MLIQETTHKKTSLQQWLSSPAGLGRGRPGAVSGWSSEDCPAALRIHPVPAVPRLGIWNKTRVVTLKMTKVSRLTKDLIAVYRSHW